MRYRGQSYEIEVALGPRFIADFHEAHRRTFGHATPAAAVEVVNLRLRSHAEGPAIVPARITSAIKEPTGAQENPDNYLQNVPRCADL